MEYRPFYLAKSLAALGVNTTILTASFSHLRKKNLQLDKDIVLLKFQGVRFCVIQTPKYQSNGADRAVNVMHFTTKLWHYRNKISDKLKPDVVIASSTHPFDFLAAKAIAKRNNAVIIFEVHDIWPLSLIELYGFSPVHPLMRLIDHCTRFALENSDAVITLLPRLSDYCREYRIQPRRIAYLPNGAAQPAAITPPLEHLNAINQARHQYRGIVMYAGGIARANVVDEFLAIAKIMPDIGFICVGEGQEKEQLNKIKPKNVVFMPGVAHAQLPMLLQTADVLWIGVQNLKVYRYGFAMNKLYDYMASGRPVVISAPSKYHPISYANCGITVPSSDKIKTQNAIRYLLSLSPMQREEMGMRGKAVIEQQYRYPLIAVRYHLFLEELISGKQKETRKNSYRDKKKKF